MINQDETKQNKTQAELQDIIFPLKVHVTRGEPPAVVQDSRNSTTFHTYLPNTTNRPRPTKSLRNRFVVFLQQPLFLLQRLQLCHGPERRAPGWPFAQLPRRARGRWRGSRLSGLVWNERWSIFVRLLSARARGVKGRRQIRGWGRGGSCETGQSEESPGVAVPIGVWVWGVSFGFLSAKE